jgi:hypothetical protein
MADEYIANISHWRNDTDKIRLKYSEKILSQCHFVHRRYHTNWPWGQIRLPNWQISDYLPETGHCQASRKFPVFHDTRRSVDWAHQNLSLVRAIRHLIQIHILTGCLISILIFFSKYASKLISCFQFLRLKSHMRILMHCPSCKSPSSHPPWFFFTQIQGASVNRVILQHWGGCRYRHFAVKF